MAGLPPSYIPYSIMHANSWNLRSRKERLEILERTEAHRKHLVNIMRAKSKVDSKNKQGLKHHNSLPGNILRRKDIAKDNESMIHRIMEINNSRAKLPARPKSQLSEVGRNLKTYSSLNRTLRLREIEDQNTKMFSRLISTSPTIRREQWIKREVLTNKYKENLHRSKCTRVASQTGSRTTRRRPAASSPTPPSSAACTSTGRPPASPAFPRSRATDPPDARCLAPQCCPELPFSSVV